MTKSRHDLSAQNNLPSLGEPLIFWIGPDKAAPYEANLASLVLGEWEPAPAVRKGARARKPGKFEGRGALATEFAEWLCKTRPPPTAFKSNYHAIRTLFHFLQHVDPNVTIRSASDLADAHGPMLESWLNGKQTYTPINTLVSRLRALRGKSPLLWPPEPKKITGLKSTIDLSAMKSLHKALKAEARQVKDMFAQGMILANSGADPRFGTTRETLDQWNSRENQAWLTRAILQREAFTTPPDQESTQGIRFRGVPQSPGYWAPCMRRTPNVELGHRLRWFTPGFRDTALFLWLFLIKTGWNLATALAIDISLPAWASEDIAKRGFTTITAFKERANREHRFDSKTRDEWDAFQIIHYLKQQTEPLRAILRSRIESARMLARTDTSSLVAREIAVMETTLRSPWLYHRIVEGIEVRALHHTDSGQLSRTPRVVAEQHDLHPDLARISTSSPRHTLLGGVYEKSGSNIIVTQAVAQHRSAKTTHRYLRTRSIRDAGEARFRAFQVAAFQEIAARKPLNATRLNVLLKNGEITEEQERRLLDLRMRTKLGMGCKDPMFPPDDVAPGHRSGELCAVQRCTGCMHGLVFEESLPRMAHRLVELRLTQIEMANDAWKDSSFEAEANSIEATLQQFDTPEVIAVLNEWSGKFSRGDLHVQHIFPGQ